MCMKCNWIERARVRMKEIGLSQEMLANALGCTRGAVGHYLSGRREPSLERLGIIAETLGLDTKWMVFGEDEWGGIGEPVQAYGDALLKDRRYVPVRGTTAAGHGRRRFGMLDLAGCSGAYALLVEGSTWDPRIREGDVISLCPDRIPQPGDEVWVEYSDGGRDLRVLVRFRDDEVVLESVTEQRQRQILNRGDIKSMHYLLAVFRGVDGE